MTPIENRFRLGREHAVVAMDTSGVFADGKVTDFTNGPQGIYPTAVVKLTPRSRILLTRLAQKEYHWGKVRRESKAFMSGRQSAKHTTARLVLVGASLATLICTFAVSPPPWADAAHAASNITVMPDFSSNGLGWIATDSNFLPPKSGHGPVTSDPTYPFVPNNTGDQPTFRVADLDNPILMSWVREELRKRNGVVLSGKIALTRPNRCWPSGVPAILLAIIQPVYFVQTPDVVWQMWQNDHYVRRIYLNQKHSTNPGPSWFGESVGHYEGDTLVVDTIGLNTKTYLDNFNTPHTDRLHVVERYRLDDGGRMLEVIVTIDDPGAFTMPWSAIERFRRAQQGPMLESRCAENNASYFNYEVEPIPQSNRPDF